MKSNFASAAPTQNSTRFFIIENKQFRQLKNFKENFIQNFYYDVKIKKKVVSKLGKKTAYSSSSWCNSPEYLRFKILYHFFEGVKKKNFRQNYKTFFNFSRLVSKYLRIFPRSWGQTIAQTTQHTVIHLNKLYPYLPR